MDAAGHRSTTRVLDILELLARDKKGHTLKELSELLDAPKSSLSPIVHTLADRGYIQNVSESGRYVIGRQTYFTGKAYQDVLSPNEFVRNEMQQIVDTCHETCHLGVLAGGNVLYVGKIDADASIILRSHIGQLLPAYCTGLGKALICDLSLDELKQLYPNGLVKYTKYTIVSFDEIYQELQEAAETGFSYERSEFTDGVVCVAVSLRRTEKIIASLSVCVPTFRATEETLSEIKKLLMKAKFTIEQYIEEQNISDGYYLA